MPKPRSWKEVLAHPDIESIDDDREWARINDPHSEDCNIWVNLHDHVQNPVCGTEGGGFYAGDMKDVISHFYWN